MAKQQGIIKLAGTLGGLNFYYRNGKPMVRAAGGGFDGKKIKDSPKMVRVRENASEFGSCSKVKKALRIALHPFLGKHKDATLHGRMMKLLQDIKTHDSVSARGQRKVGIGMQTEAGKQLLRGFVFSPKYSLEQLLGATERLDADTFAYAVDDFSVDRVRFPVGATHLEILYGALRFDFDTLTHAVTLCPPLLIARHAGETSLDLSVAALPDGGGMLMGVGCVRFLQEVNGVMVGIGDFGCGVVRIES
ncbi:hypothetical protein HYN48_12240 [Flavobacterium magnum]|uniref:Uncharacterized protein n=1 Tax=Flavobacterium magnum TaxID=2162713 RepID=A0A2S0RGL0_9FLAO|nr:hypothetical protein [Flavobacterium magnum]AWA30786.1 hypothetical protein HYN48_12240 [Flavobacterium magnum]